MKTPFDDLIKDWNITVKTDVPYSKANVRNREIWWAADIRGSRTFTTLAHELGHFGCGHFGFRSANSWGVLQEEMDAWDYAENLCKMLNVPFDYDDKRSALDSYVHGRCLLWGK